MWVRMGPTDEEAAMEQTIEFTISREEEEEATTIPSEIGFP